MRSYKSKKGYYYKIYKNGKKKELAKKNIRCYEKHIK